jgi:hypothetical protein
MPSVLMSVFPPIPLPKYSPLPSSLICLFYLRSFRSVRIQCVGNGSVHRGPEIEAATLKNGNRSRFPSRIFQTTCMADTLASSLPPHFVPDEQSFTMPQSAPEALTDVERPRDWRFWCIILTLATCMLLTAIEFVSHFLSDFALLIPFRRPSVLRYLSL